MRSLKITYHILRITIVSIISMLIGAYIILFLILSTPSTQNKIREIGEKELSNLLHTDVRIGSISISPFNQLMLYDVKVEDQKKKDLLKIDKLGAGVSLYNLILNQRLVFTYAEIVGLTGNIYKENPKAPTNLQFIIDALKSKEDNKPPKQFDIKIYNIVIRKSNLNYNVLSEPFMEGKFDKNHISITNLTADIALPKLKNDDFKINIKRLALREQSGFELKNFAAETSITNKSLIVEGLKIELPNTNFYPQTIQINYDNLKDLGKGKFDFKFEVANSKITLNDFKCFVPLFNNYNDPLYLTLGTHGKIKDIHLDVLNITTENQRLNLDLSGELINIDDIENLIVNLPHIKINANADEISKITSNLTRVSPGVLALISRSGNISYDGVIKKSVDDVKMLGNLSTSLGTIKLNGNIYKLEDKFKNIRFDGNVSTQDFDIGKLLNKSNLIEKTAFNIKLNMLKSAKRLSGKVIGNINYLDFKGYRYSGITTNMAFGKSEFEGSLDIQDPNLNLSLNGLAELKGADSRIDLQTIIKDANLAELHLDKKHVGNKLSLLLDASFTGNNIDNANGFLSIKDIKYIDNLSEGLVLDSISVVADNIEIPHSIKINSDFLEGKIWGEYDFKTLVPNAKLILSKAFPSLITIDEKKLPKGANNDFLFDLRLLTNSQLTDFFNLPIRVIYPIKISGGLTEANGIMNLSVNAPYLQQKNKIIENSGLTVNIDNGNEICNLELRTILPNKKGNISVNFRANGANDRLDTDLDWVVARDRDFHGNVNLSTLVKRNDENKLEALVTINPSELVFNDTTWYMHPSSIDLSPTTGISVSNFNVDCEKQFIKINGIASKNPEDRMMVELQDINLDYIFKTLEIGNVTFGGRATGKFYAEDILSKSPRLSTPNLHVVNFSYNNAIFGDADIKSSWDNETKGININADIKQANGEHSKVDGAIYPTLDSLYLDFTAKKLNIAFLQPFLSAVTSDITGHASGNATLYGNFKRINLKGDVFADDLKLKIDYINTVYTASDSVKLRPGLIEINNITLYDKYGHTAKLNGVVNHRYFLDANFNFSITEASDFLCFDIPETISPTWYGTIFGDGSAFIKGEPGEVSIDVNMATAANSKFNFVLSNSMAATDYTFITILDRNKKSASIEEIDTIPEIVKKLKMPKQITQGLPSTFNLNLQVEATPLAQMILVMDPVGGDRIKANGSGNLRLTYGSVDGDIKMFGNYTLERGSYNFTLQDIIVKDFSIREGSTISFLGDPMQANLDISAAYSLNANLTDLDESFAEDKDMNRTNVPVKALLNLKGDIQQPIISFDIEFPTLTQDAYRKVKSIISTEDMMNRQIIYLLALNRFYTPEYMGSTSKNNEFASVASSTISSKLSNILGQMSDKFSIAPNFRTDKGDFSDVEVDVALSSQLLNNRLLLNGNLGYRDNTLNTNNNNFIGEFDIEYLLNKNGNVRLKAYNHNNDQNYYVKNAKTTQGVGIVFKYDFEKPFDFLRKRRNSKTKNLKSDSVVGSPTERKDSVK